MLRFAYRFTKNSSNEGRMFIFASFFYLVAVGCGSALPNDQPNSKRRGDRNDDDEDDALLSTNNSYNITQK